MSQSLSDIEDLAGFELFDYQREYLEVVRDLPAPQRTCLYYKTGAGKSLTSLASIKMWGYDTCLVITPPATHDQWERLGKQIGVKVQPMSHAKFRMKNTRLSKTTPVIADEFHLFGGQKGMGWRKLDTMARHLQAPLILMSATPNYNDAERVYCVQHILSPFVTKGGYLQFLYENCRTEQNRFSMEPVVLGFKDYPDAASFLADLPRVFYLPDTTVFTIKDISYLADLPEELYTYGYNRRRHRVIASQMELRHTEQYQSLVGEDGYIHCHVMAEVNKILERPGGVLLYSNHATVAAALSNTLHKDGVKHGLLTGTSTAKRKQEVLTEIFDGTHRVLVGTATIATGLDGLDKVCHTLLIVDDTDDSALRRQLIGRILPRGDFVSLVDKEVFRLTPDAARP